MYELLAASVPCLHDVGKETYVCWHGAALWLNLLTGAFHTCFLFAGFAFQNGNSHEYEDHLHFGVRNNWPEVDGS